MPTKSQRFRGVTRGDRVAISPPTKKRRPKISTISRGYGRAAKSCHHANRIASRGRADAMSFDVRSRTSQRTARGALARKLLTRHLLCLLLCGMLCRVRIRKCCAMCCAICWLFHRQVKSAVRDACTQVLRQTLCRRTKQSPSISAWASPCGLTRLLLHHPPPHSPCRVPGSPMCSLTSSTPCTSRSRTHRQASCAPLCLPLRCTHQHMTSTLHCRLS